MPEVLWVARHCIQCYKTPAECAICGCHEPAEKPSATWKLPSLAPVDNHTGGVGSNGDTWVNTQHEPGASNAP